MYVDFTYYKDSFGGTSISETDFIKYERKARVFMDYITFERLKGESVIISEEVKNCICEIMESMQEVDANKEEKLISSETVDNHSVTYAISDIEKNAIDKSQVNKVKFYNIAKLYLSGTGLLYRGR